MKISVISVLYDQKLEAGNTWNTLLLPVLQTSGDFGEAESTESERQSKNDQAIQILLADNSDDPQIREENRRTAEAYGAVYLDMQGNQGLPKAYNRAVENLLSQEEGLADEWIVLTDQDTVFPSNYLQILSQTAVLTDCEVLAPVVKAGSRQLSPCRKKGMRFVPYGTEILSETEVQEAFFINTGLAFRNTLFEDPRIRFEERLFLDFTDFDMINRLRAWKRVRCGQLSGIVLQQNFSGTEARTADQDLERFRHYVHDGRLFYERWYGEGAAERTLRIRAMHLAARHRDPRFLKACVGP